MHDLNRSAEWPAGLIIATGCVLALSVAIMPWYTGSYRLHADVLIFALLPYLVYASLMRTLRGASLMLAGLALVVTDILARTVFHATAGTPPETGRVIGYCLSMLLVVMPAGGLLGWLIGRRRSQSG
jgi:integral membrane sensor domain MASE1